jgi:hypothetical protein
MGRVIPNEQTWVGFTPTIASITAPTEIELNLCTDLTPFLMSINASAQGNQVPTPSFDSLFETSIVGTSQATFSADFYRDSVADTAWTTFPRGTKGFIVISRFGGTGPDQIPRNGDYCEVWPVEVVSRTAANMQNNAVQTFTMTCAVNTVPAETAQVSGGTSGVPSAPLNVTGVATAATTATIDFDAPAYVGAGLTSPFYAVYKAATVGGSYTLCTATIIGTTADVTGLTTATTSYFKVLAHNAAGDGPLSVASGSVTQP